MLTARALIDQHNITQLDVTTGTLDDPASALGTQPQIKVSAYRLSCDPKHVCNPTDQDDLKKFDVDQFKNQPGYAKLTFTDLLLGEVLQVDSNLRGADPHHNNDTDHVKVSGIVVKRYPDPAALLLTASNAGPSGIQIPVGQPADFTLTVAEMNGADISIGAHMDVIMLANGAQIDQAKGIWVDAGGVVAVKFHKIFTTAGPVHLQVRLENVVPRAWDSTNNTISLDIVVVPNTLPMNFSASLKSVSIKGSTLSRNWYPGPNGAINMSQPADSEFQDSRSGNTQDVFLNGMVAGLIPLPANIAVQETINGAAALSVSHQFTANDLSLPGGTLPAGSAYVGSYYDIATGATVQLILTVGTDPSQTYSLLNYSRDAGTVTYFSSGYVGFWDATHSNLTTYSSNSSSPLYAFGAVLPISAQTYYGLTFNLTFASGSYNAVAAFNGFQPWLYEQNIPYGCAVYSDNQGKPQGGQCFQWTLSEDGLFSSTYGAAYCSGVGCPR